MCSALATEKITQGIPHYMMPLWAKYPNFCLGIRGIFDSDELA